MSPIFYTFVMKSNTQVELQKLWKVKDNTYTNKNYVHSGKPSIAEIEIEIAFTIIKFEMHMCVLRTYVYCAKF